MDYLAIYFITNNIKESNSTKGRMVIIQEFGSYIQGRTRIIYKREECCQHMGLRAFLAKHMWQTGHIMVVECTIHLVCHDVGYIKS